MVYFALLHLILLLISIIAFQKRFSGMVIKTYGNSLHRHGQVGPKGLCPCAMPLWKLRKSNCGTRSLHDSNKEIYRWLNSCIIW